jgi:hypothetical protein
MFHLGDVVQEISTGRSGKVDEIRSEGVVGQEQIPSLWRVMFSDGKTPPLDYFKEAQLRLIECPHNKSEGDSILTVQSWNRRIESRISPARCFVGRPATGGSR